MLKNLVLMQKFKKIIDLYQICLFCLKLLKRSLLLVLFRTLRTMPLLINFSPRTSVVIARKLHYSVYYSALLCITLHYSVYSDIVTTIGKGNGSFLVLLDLSAAFDTIDHGNLFDILEKYVLQFIKPYFFDRSQSTRIESIMSDILHIICGVPQGSVLGPLKFCI